MSSKVKVAVRVRPLNKREVGMGGSIVVDMERDQTILSHTNKRKATKTFAFDHCFWSMDPDNPKFANQELVFEKLGTDVLENAFSGYNACIFAYGQTGSGKSYTMMGSLDDDHLKGVIPRLCDTLFNRIAENDNARLSYKVEVSYMEIYCEKVRDLLCPKGGKHSLKVREHKALGPYVENLSKLAVASFEDINSLMSEGNKSRTVACTQMNAESSRSHAVFSIVLTQTHFDPASATGTEKVAKISLVDLAGSERVAKTGALGDRLKEGSNINKSLSTLGLVISALADMSAGKKARNSYVPYRDSILTWLLKDNLGGNSKTVMVATVSPASDNYEESLSTLRYADRAKRIVNHAVVNEDPNSRMIRELREEVEKLRAMLTGGGSGEGGGAGGGVSTKEMEALMEKLRIGEGLMAELSKSWEQKLAETERIHQERQKALENMGISVQASGIGVQVDKFYLVNLNADPSMNALLVCYLKDVTRIGRAGTTPVQDIQLKGLGISNEHCVIEIVDKEIFLTAHQGPRTLVNGHPVTEKVQLHHGARILLGNNHLYRLSCPRLAGAPSDPEDEPIMDYEQAMKEISLNELTNDPMYVKMQKELMEKHEAEKEGALEAQKERYEKQLAELKVQLETNTSASPTPPTTGTTSTATTGTTTPPTTGTTSTATSATPNTSAKARPGISPTLEEEWERKNRERLINTVLKANRLTQEANMLSEALHKDTIFKVTLTVPRSFLTPRQRSEVDEVHSSNEVAIRVLHKQRGTDSVWSLETLEEKVLTMRDMYERMEEGDDSLLLDESLGPDPFYDLEQHALLGVANIFMECLHHNVAQEYDAPIVAPTGKVCGKLKMVVQKIETTPPDPSEEVDVPGVLEVLEEGAELRPGTQFSCQVSVIEATGLPKEYCHYVFCQYKFWGQDEALIIPPLVQSGMNRLPDGMQRFDHSQSVTVEVTDEFLEFIEEGALAVEVWGHRRSGFDLHVPGSEEGEGKRLKTFPERWSELTRRLEVWVEIMELNDQGEYVPVEIQNKPDVTTGGVFMIRQGQSRRIHVSVHPVEGSGNSPLKCECITSVSIGSIYLRSRYDEPIDSNQEADLERLRTKWSEALMNRRDYLDTEVRKLMDKRELKVSDLERQNELLDQWAMLQWQRAAVLQPKAGSGVPGAPANWHLEPGMESHVPVLFLDLNDDLLTPCDDDPVAAVTTGTLFGEKPETMIEIPIIKKEEREPRAVVSWDSTVHDNSSLNKTTGSNDRVYAILKVTVILSHPPGIELVLRKRICLRVYKKLGFGAALMRAIAGKETRTVCGVMYEVVMGIPKSEGMYQTPKIPANPSFVELDEDENAVEKFKKAMSSISNILALDRLKQEVALKEKLAGSGKVLRKRYSTQLTQPFGDSAPVTPLSLSRAESRAESPEPGEETPPNGAPTQTENIISQSEMLASHPLPEDEEATTVGGGTSGLGLGAVGGEPEVGPSPVMLELDETGTVIGKRDALPEEVMGTVGGDVLMLRGMLDVIPEEEQLGSPTEVVGGGAVGVVTEDVISEPMQEEEGEKVAVVDEESGGGMVEGEGVSSDHEGVAERSGDHEGVAERSGDHEGVAERSGDHESVAEGSGDHEVVAEGSGDREGVAEGSGAGVMEESGGGVTSVEKGEAVTGKESGADVAMKEGSGDSAVEESSVGVVGEGSRGGTVELSEVPAIMTSEENEQQEEEPPQGMNRDDRELSSERRHSAGDVLDTKAPVKHKPPPSPHSRSTSTSPLLERGRKSEGGGATKRVASPLGISRKENSSNVGAAKREASPTPSSGESETSSVSETATPSSTAKAAPCTVGEKVIVDLSGGGYKLGVVKYVGETEFSLGEWVGVALDRPYGKHSGTVKGVKYFKCKEKHGIFVKRDKVVHEPSSGSPSPSRPSSKSPSIKRKPMSNPYPLVGKSSSAYRPKLSSGAGRRT